MRPENLATLAEEFSEFRNVSLSGSKEPVPAGIYITSVAKAYWDKASTGTPCVVWELKIVDGDHMDLSLIHI